MKKIILQNYKFNSIQTKTEWTTSVDKKFAIIYRYLGVKKKIKKMYIHQYWYVHINGRKNYMLTYGTRSAGEVFLGSPTIRGRASWRRRGSKGAKTTSIAKMGKNDGFHFDMVKFCSYRLTATTVRTAWWTSWRDGWKVWRSDNTSAEIQGAPQTARNWRMSDQIWTLHLTTPATYRTKRAF